LPFTTYSSSFTSIKGTFTLIFSTRGKTHFYTNPRFFSLHYALALLVCVCVYPSDNASPPRSANSYSNGEWRERRSHPGINCPLRRPQRVTSRARARSRSARRPATRTDLCLRDHIGRVAGKYEETTLAGSLKTQITGYHTFMAVTGRHVPPHARGFFRGETPITVRGDTQVSKRYKIPPTRHCTNHLCAWGYIRRCEVLTDRGILLVENLLSIPKS